MEMINPIFRASGSSETYSLWKQLIAYTENGIKQKSNANK